MGRLPLLTGLGALLALAGCASRPAPAPSPAPAPAPTPIVTTPDLPSPVPPSADWRDLPLSAGDWSYVEQGSVSEARFGQGGGAAFTLRCDKAARRLALARSGATAGPMIVRTTSEARNFPAPSASLAPFDALIDAIAFSRGRFTVEQAGLERLILPAWPETARVAEDCRS